MKREWIFSDASLGPYDGFNNAAMDHFRDDNSIFREVIQNSIDNKDTKIKRPVLIKFEKKTFPAEKSLKLIFEFQNAHKSYGLSQRNFL